MDKHNPIQSLAKLLIQLALLEAIMEKPEPKFYKLKKPFAVWDKDTVFNSENGLRTGVIDSDTGNIIDFDNTEYFEPTSLDNSMQEVVYYKQKNEITEIKKDKTKVELNFPYNN